MKSILDKISAFFNAIKKAKIKPSQDTQQQPILKYHLIEIIRPNKIRIRTITADELPPNLSPSYACEIEDPMGNRGIGFLVVRHNLEPLVDIPIVKIFLEENRIVPIDISKIFRYKVEEIKLGLYKAFELVKAGEWGKFAFERNQNVKPIKWENILFWALVFIVGIIIFLVISYIFKLGPFAYREAATITKEAVKTAINMTKIT